jgi:hypothetical protein
VSVWADFAAAFAARGAALVGEPLADLAAERLTPAPAGGLAAVRFTGSSVAGRALVAAT